MTMSVPDYLYFVRTGELKINSKYSEVLKELCKDLIYEVPENRPSTLSIIERLAV